MFGLVARLIGGAVTPLIDQASASGARLLLKLALLAVSALATAVAMFALTIAFGLWIARMKGPIAGALAIAGLYAVIAAIALFFAFRPRRSDKAAARARGGEKRAAAGKKAKEAGIDEFTAPLLRMLERAGLKKEQLAVLAGASVAKRIGPIPMVGLAIVAGFLIGRTWRGLFSSDLLAGILASDLFAGLSGGTKPPDSAVTPDGEADRDRAAA